MSVIEAMTNKIIFKPKLFAVFQEIFDFRILRVKRLHNKQITEPGYRILSLFFVKEGTRKFCNLIADYQHSTKQR